MFYQWVKEVVVKKQVGIFGGFFICVVVGEGIVWGQVEYYVDFVCQCQFMISCYCFGVCQYNVKCYLCCQLVIFFIWIVEVVQVVFFNWYNWFVEGYLVFNFMVKQVKGGVGKVGKQFGYVC